MEIYCKNDFTIKRIIYRAYFISEERLYTDNDRFSSLKDSLLKNTPIRIELILPETIEMPVIFDSIHVEVYPFSSKSINNDIHLKSLFISNLKSNYNPDVVLGKKFSDYDSVVINKGNYPLSSFLYADYNPPNSSDSIFIVKTSFNIRSNGWSDIVNLQDTVFQRIRLSKLSNFRVH